VLSNRSMPRSTVIPELGYRDVAAAGEWLCRAFGFTRRLRIGAHRLQLNAGDGALVLTAMDPSGAIGASHSVMIRVEDVDAHHHRAVIEGATIVRPPQDHPYGERQYTAADPAGRRWTFSQSIADVDPASWGGELVTPDTDS
jgi:uncharacterized glyoxalase superfamily protein PhnB